MKIVLISFPGFKKREYIANLLYEKITEILIL